ncbi:hypothetical protein ACP6PL_06820 [Dapis sp. BLCC M126]|uniref:hypothetical protein n=1 Tax=Dapis sp. BLCC M126 TaxID=3400189 RepID=UPI003CF42A3B
MANLNITDLNPELMAEAIANAQARRNNSVSDISEQEAAEVVGGFDTISPFVCKGWICPPIVVGLIYVPEPTIAIK